MKKALIIGGGFAGCAAAHQIELAGGGWDVTLVERAPFLGGGVKTHWRGGHPFTFGPRHFLTPMEELFDYLNAIVPMRRSEEHTSELQSLMRISYAVFCLKKKNQNAQIVVRFLLANNKHK